MDKSLVQAVVGILLLPKNRKVDPYCYTSFLIDIDDQWILITASHCKKLIVDAKKRLPDLCMMLVGYSGERWQHVAIAQDSLVFSDFSLSMLEYIRNGVPGFEDFTERDAELLDICFSPVTGTIRDYLVNVGCKPYSLEQVTPTIETAQSICEHDNKCIIAFGFPELLSRKYEESKEFKCELKSFPLVPYTEDKLSDESTASMFRPYFYWLKPDWNEDYWNNHVVGISGGPVILSDSHQHVVLGLVSRQFPQSKPERIGVVATDIIFSLLYEILAED